MSQKLDSETPPIMMVTLNRFYFDVKTLSRKKRKDPIDLSYSITITPEFLHSEDIKENDEIVYDLYAIVIHSGMSAHSGHYYTIAKDPMSQDKPVWKSYNDAMVSDISDDFLAEISSKIKYDTPYILFYKERKPGLRTMKMKDEGIRDDCLGVNLPDDYYTNFHSNIPETLKKFVETDSESYLKEKELITMRMNKKQYAGNDMNFELLKELQKQLMRANSSGFDEARTMGPGSFGGYGPNNDFFGGGGGI
jgi:hypothetical protein